jgi:hypothetical protein
VLDDHLKYFIGGSKRMTIWTFQPENATMDAMTKRRAFKIIFPSFGAF